MTTPEAFFNVATRTFSETKEPTDGHCSNVINEAFEAIETVKSHIADQADDLKTILNLCDPVKTADDIEDVYQHFSSGLLYMAMTDYPTEADFLEPMPANPVNESCKFFKDIVYPAPTKVEELERMHDSNAAVPMTARAKEVLTAFNKAVNIYFNYKADPIKCAKWNQTDATGNLGDGQGWNALACNEIDMPQGSNGMKGTPPDMFLPRPFDKKTDMANCKSKFGEYPQYDWALDYFGGRNIQTDYAAYSNIVFSNGSRDPWSAGGVTKNVTAWANGEGEMWKSIALYIHGSAHHLDLRPPAKEGEPEEVENARKTERAYIKKWVADYAALWEAPKSETDFLQE